jgi:ribosome-binding protein aMBF1 (putative translation factor)
MHITDWKTHRAKLLENPKVRAALEENELEYQIARSLIEARIKHNLTQAELAEKLNTKQSVISRVESAKTTPSLSFLKRVADVLGTSLQVQFK